MAVIHELSPHLADLIAAGEVVERPSSVAKELVENAIDAGSTRITVEIENGGITYLRIADNGCGMSPELVARVTDPFTTSRKTRRVRRVRLRVCTCIWKPVRFRHRRKPAVRKAQQSLCATCSSTHRLA